MIPIMDNRGNRFSSVAELCRYYMIPMSTFYYHIKNLISIGEINIKFENGKYKLIGSKDVTVLDCFRKQYKNDRDITFEQSYKHHRKHRNAKCTDHLGNKYQNINEMCNTYGLSRATFSSRLSKGWSLQDALTTPVRCRNNWIDHLGNKYQTINDMCSAYGMSDTTFRSRIALGWSVEKALTEPIKSVANHVTDPFGNEFTSEAQMAKYWGIDYNTYAKRKERGWSLMRRLSENNTQMYKTSAIDHIGNEYENIQAMCKAYNVNFSTFKTRYYTNGWTLQESLEGRKKKS